MSQPRAYSYVRDSAATRGLSPQEKFAGLFELIDRAKAAEESDRPSVIMVHNPTVLGDDYDELVCNLCFIADAGLMAAISDDGAREVLERGERYPPSG